MRQIPEFAQFNHFSDVFLTHVRNCRTTPLRTMGGFFLAQHPDIQRVDANGMSVLPEECAKLVNLGTQILGRN
jgi:hypothetical protein